MRLPEPLVRDLYTCRAYVFVWLGLSAILFWLEIFTKCNIELREFVDENTKTFTTIARRCHANNPKFRRCRGNFCNSVSNKRILILRAHAEKKYRFPRDDQFFCQHIYANIILVRSKRPLLLALQYLFLTLCTSGVC